MTVCTLINRRPVLIAAALLALLFTSLAASAAPAGVAERRQQAQAARAEMVRLGEELTPAIERYNQAVAQLEQVEADIAFNKRQITVTKDNLKVTQAELNRQLDQAYRVGSPDLLSSVLSQTSISEVLAVADLFARTQNQSANLVEGLRKDRRSLARRQRALDAAQQEAKALRATRAEQQRAIEAGIAEQQALVAGLEDEIAALIAEEQARQERIREQALAALEAYENAAQANGVSDDIAIGGSVDGDASASTDTESAPAEPAAAPVELPPTDGSLGARAVAVAMQYLGTPYVWGGSSPGGFDCSGLTMYAYAQVGVSLSHYTGDQWNEGARVPSDQLLPGDLVFFHSDLHHMGMYIGNGQMIHAPQTGDVVKISPLMDAYAGAVRPY